jgi:hypothetical protein
MEDRVYLSTISAAWPLPKQREVLAELLAVPLMPVYEDVVTARARKAHRGDDLPERGAMLRPTGRKPAGEVIHVASLSVLAWTPEDLVSVLAAAAGRHASIRAHDIGLTIPPTDAAVQAHEAVQAFIRSRRNAQTSIGRAGGSAVAAANRKAATAGKIELIRARWPLRDISTRELLAEAGLSYLTAKDHLGGRPKAQRDYERKMARKAAKESRNG